MGAKPRPRQPGQRRMRGKLGFIVEEGFMDILFAMLAGTIAPGPLNSIMIVEPGRTFLKVPSFPVTVNAGIVAVFQLQLEPSECGVEHIAHLEFWDEQAGPAMQVGEHRFTMEQDRSDLEVSAIILQIAAPLMRFPRAGVYEFRLLLDGALRYTLPLQMLS